MIDYEALKKTNPDLYRLVVVGKGSRLLMDGLGVKGIGSILDQFPIQDQEQKEMFTNALIGFGVNTILNSIGQGAAKQLMGGTKTRKKRK